MIGRTRCACILGVSCMARCSSSRATLWLSAAPPPPWRSSTSTPLRRLSAAGQPPHRPDDRPDDIACRIQQAHLRHRGHVGALSVVPQVEDRFGHRRGGLLRIVQGEGIRVPIIRCHVRRRALLDAEAVGERCRRYVPQVNRIAVAFRFPVLSGVEDDGDSLLPGTFVFAVRQAVPSVQRMCPDVPPYRALRYARRRRQGRWP